MVADGLKVVRRNLLLAGLVTIFLALVLGVILEFQAFRSRLATAEHDNQVLAQQVRDLGGTPRTGQPGAAGSPGPAGSPGQNGTPGRNGSNGSNGSSGPVGPSGAKGATGATGPAGSPGSPGATGATGPQGAAGSAGPKGDPGPAGSTGPTGPPPSSWTWTYLGVTYTCTQDSPGSTTYTCSPSGAIPPAARRKKP